MCSQGLRLLPFFLLLLLLGLPEDIAAVGVQATLRCSTNYRGVVVRSGESVYTSADACWLQLAFGALSPR